MPFVGIGVGIGRQRFAQGGGFVGLLDEYSGAAAAYSLRQLSSTYTGNAIRIRRASDNTEQNIGFDALGNLDTTALTTFCSGTNGFVTTWYDQSGNGNNLVQTTATSQAKIYDSINGVLLMNSKPSISLSLTNFYNFTTNITSSSWSYYSVMKLSATSYANFGGIVGNSLSGGFMYHNTSGGFLLRTSSYNSLIPQEINQTSQILLSQLTDGTNVKGYGWSNGVAKNQNVTLTGTLSQTFNQFNFQAFFARRNEMDFQELVLYNSYNSSDRSGVESNINSYYAIY